MTMTMSHYQMVSRTAAGNKSTKLTPKLNLKTDEYSVDSQTNMPHKLYVDSYVVTLKAVSVDTFVSLVF